MGEPRRIENNQLTVAPYIRPVTNNERNRKQMPENPARTSANPGRYVVNEFPAFMFQVKARTEISPIYRLDASGAHGPEVLADLTLNQLANGKVTWLTFNFPLKTLNDTHGHNAGDSYLSALTHRLKETAVKMGATLDGAPVIVRRGPNYSVFIPQSINSQEALTEFGDAIRKENLEISFENSKRKIETWELSLEPNSDIMTFDPEKGEIGRHEILRADSENIHYLNKGQEGGRMGKEVVVDPVRISKYNLSERVVGEFSLEPLSYYDKFEARVKEAILKMRNGEAGKGTVVFFDGNKTGAYRSYGFAGDVMIDAIFNVRFAQVAKAVFPEDFIFVRYGAGSEEFFVYGEVDAPAMQKYMEKFMRTVHEPFYIRMEVGELKATELGRSYLEGKYTGKRPIPYEYTYPDGKKVMVVDVDANAPRGSNGEYFGITQTAAIKEIDLRDPMAVKRIKEGDPPINAIFEENIKALNRAGESAKETNVKRTNMLVLGRTGGSYQKVIPEGMRELAIEMGITPETWEKLQKSGAWEKVSNALAKKLARPEKLEAWLNSAEGQALLKDPVKAPRLKEMVLEAQRIMQGNQVLKAHGTGLLVGLATLLGAEKLADILEINSPAQRFAFVIGISHTANFTTIKLFEKGGLQTAYEGFLNSTRAMVARDASLAARFAIPAKPLASFSINLLRGLGEIAVVSNALRKVGIDGTANTVLSFATPIAAKAGMDYYLARTGGAAAGRLGINALRVAGGAFSIAATAAFAGDTLISFMNGDYANSVQERGLKILKDEGYYEPGIWGTMESVLTPSGHRGQVVDEGNYLNVSQGYVDRLRAKIIDEDRGLSYNLRASLAEMFAPALTSGNPNEMVYEYLSPIEWERVDTGEKSVRGNYWKGEYLERSISVSVAEKDIYTFAASFIREHKYGSFDDPAVIDATVKKFGLKDASQYTALFPKFERQIIQQQFAILYFLDPQGYGKTSFELSGQKTLNQDIREMFENDGTLKPGMGSQFIRWIKNNI